MLNKIQEENRQIGKVFCNKSFIYIKSRTTLLVEVKGKP